MSVLLCGRSARVECRESFSGAGCGRVEGHMPSWKTAWLIVPSALFRETQSCASDAAPATACGEAVTYGAHHFAFEHAHAHADLSRTLSETANGFTGVEHHFSRKENLSENADAVLIRRMLRQADRVKSKSLRAYLGDASVKENVDAAEHRVLKMPAQTHFMHPRRTSRR
ncbi:hypothetical protein T484DRAFT_1903746 [Baffinella frigidus]|nr:hypothetical protein T484DRAFT_1903746 [Cryptophyta sp. CCMP2293]